MQMNINQSKFVVSMFINLSFYCVDRVIRETLEQYMDIFSHMWPQTSSPWKEVKRNVACVCVLL